MCLAIPGLLVSTEGEGELRSGEVDFGGVSRTTNLVFVPEAVPGDWLLVHVGFAIAVIDERVAEETRDALTMLDAMHDEAMGDSHEAVHMEDEDLLATDAEGTFVRPPAARRLH